MRGGAGARAGVARPRSWPARRQGTYRAEPVLERAVHRDRWREHAAFGFERVVREAQRRLAEHLRRRRVARIAGRIGDDVDQLVVTSFGDEAHFPVAARAAILRRTLAGL